MKTTKPFLARVAAIALVLSFFAACDESTEPEFQLDPETAAATVEYMVENFFEENAAAITLEYLGEAIFAALTGGAPPAPEFKASPSAAIAGGIPRHLLTNPIYSAVPARIPEAYEGVTFEWDEQEEGYVPSELTGAPANGARFILYTIYAATGLPATPLNAIGYLDISDDTAWPNVDITLEAVISNTTLIYAEVTGLFGETSAWLDFDGYFSDGNDQLPYTMYASESETGYVLELVLQYGSFTVDYDFSDTEELIEIEATLSDGTNTLVYDFDLEWTQVGQDWVYAISEGSIVTFNGETVAIIEGYVSEDTVEVTITNAEGDPLTTAELAALEFVFEAMLELHEFFEGMLEFVGELAWLNAPR